MTAAAAVVMTVAMADVAAAVVVMTADMVDVAAAVVVMAVAMVDAVAVVVVMTVAMVDVVVTVVVTGRATSATVMRELGLSSASTTGSKSAFDNLVSLYVATNIVPPIQPAVPILP